jgi:hypothetical protein
VLLQIADLGGVLSRTQTFFVENGYGKTPGGGVVPILIMICFGGIGFAWG